MTYFTLPNSLKECKTHEERVQFLREEQKRLSSKVDKTLFRKEELEEENKPSLLQDTFHQLGQGEKGGNIYFNQASVDEQQLIDWETYEATLDKSKITELIIEPNTYKFKNDSLILENYLNLETLYACGIGFREASFTNLPSLKNFTSSATM